MFDSAGTIDEHFLAIGQKAEFVAVGLDHVFLAVGVVDGLDVVLHDLDHVVREEGDFLASGVDVLLGFVTEPDLLVPVGMVDFQLVVAEPVDLLWSYRGVCIRWGRCGWWSGWSWPRGSSR